MCLQRPRRLQLTYSLRNYTRIYPYEDIIKQKLTRAAGTGFADSDMMHVFQKQGLSGVFLEMF